MESNSIEVVFYIHKREKKYNLEIPVSITINELVFALNQSFDLGINTEQITNCYLKAENPIVLLKGNKSVMDFGLRNGSIINFTL
ncbi:hypothetical protein [Anaeromicropila herbilytica]|uniref:Uncharacterized protein n=1 Tax=Anaeromicropila herbilytica TaxID=2785025 RepID=A0A7R7EP63_9FIRM|nr:hypothetical protein [Anaeromicropila herbilytica]BCN32354.1 hypothetical protein bsdtb5_36490 [Anaeromicropila herbilytica]